MLLDRLTGLTIASATLYPAFSSSIYSYVVNVSGTVTSVSVSFPQADIILDPLVLRVLLLLLVLQDQ